MIRFFNNNSKKAKAGQQACQSKALVPVIINYPHRPNAPVKVVWVKSTCEPVRKYPTAYTWSLKIKMELIFILKAKGDLEALSKIYNPFERRDLL